MIEVGGLERARTMLAVVAAFSCSLRATEAAVASGPVDISPPNHWAGGAQLAVDSAGDAVAVPDGQCVSGLAAP